MKRSGFVLIAVVLATGCKSPATRLKEIGDEAKLQRVAADLSTLDSCLKIYRLNSGTYPTEEQGLAALIERPTSGPLPEEWSQVMKAPLKDAWGREYRYAVREGKPVVSSAGPDASNAADDIEAVIGGGAK